MEYCSQRVAKAWQDLTSNPSPAQTEAVLRDELALRGLALTQVCRYLELIDSRLYCSRTDGFCGERARMCLALLESGGPLTNKMEPPPDAPYWRESLAELAERTSESLPAFVAEHLGDDAAKLILPFQLPGILVARHLSLHEHMCCECYKAWHPWHRSNSSRPILPDKQYSQLLRQAQPAFTRAQMVQQYLSSATENAGAHHARDGDGDSGRM